jgi:UDP-N-acetylmuramoyl-tripeptide--D-alanyl-D-alanine ligase
LIELTAADIANAVGGSLHGDPDTVVTGEAQTDSRLVGVGDLFFAMPGTVTDGHRFAAAAVDAGAALVIAERELDLPVPVVVVPASLGALWDLAREVVARVRAGGGLTVIAVTGSNGKTTT